MFLVSVTVKYFGMEMEELKITGGIFQACKVTYKAELPDRKAVRQYINYMYDTNTDCLDFTVNIKPIETRHK